MKRSLLAGCAAVALFGLTAAKCTPAQVDAVVAHYGENLESAEVATPDSVDIPVAATDPPSIDSPNVDVTADCDQISFTVRLDPGVTVLLGMSGEPPWSFEVDETGTRTVVLPVGHYNALAGFNWTIDTLDFQTTTRLAAGTVACPG